ncbi:MAG TPA: hypothetical protein VFD58_15655 [Blastocatellia bacterium]|nr:hypothetical protein [Blastocatellia bacterium]
MRYRKISASVLLAGLFFALAQMWPGDSAGAASASSAQQKPVTGNPEHDSSPVDALDQCVQKRFGTMERFGIRRVITFPYHLQHFTPENEQEKNVIAELEKDGWTVSFYLAGRSVLGAKPDKSLWEKPNNNFYTRKPINNPILLTKDAKIDDLPKPLELWEQTQKAMAAFSRAGEYDFSVGKWQIAARPVRASQQACLNCHDQRHEMVDGKVKAISQGLKIGDPLGVVLYAYTRAH